MKYYINDSLFEKKNDKALSESELMEQFSYLDCSTFDRLIEELESLGYNLYPLVD